MKKYNCGAYKVKNMLDEMIYIGGTIDLYGRKYNHFSCLKNNCHRNPNLQKAYNKDGKENFKFIILLYCEPFELRRYEQAFVDKYRNSGLLYNVCQENVENWQGVKHSVQSKIKQSNVKIGIKLPPFTEEHKRKLAISKFGKNNPNIMSKKEIIKIRELLMKRITVKEITRFTGVSSGTIVKIRNGFYDKMYNLPNQEYPVPKNIPISKKIALKIIKMLEQNISVEDIVKKLKVGRTTVYRAKNKYYHSMYNL